MLDPIQYLIDIATADLSTFAIVALPICTACAATFLQRMFG